MSSWPLRRTDRLFSQRQRFELSIGDLERICDLLFWGIVVLHFPFMADDCSLVEDLAGNVLGVEGEEEARSCGIVPFGGD